VLCRTWEGWLTDKLGNKEMIVPDVSRVYRRPYVGLTQHMELLSELFNRQRATNVYVCLLFASRPLVYASSLTHRFVRSRLSVGVAIPGPFSSPGISGILGSRGLQSLAVVQLIDLKIRFFNVFFYFGQVFTFLNVFFIFQTFFI